MAVVFLLPPAGLSPRARLRPAARDPNATTSARKEERRRDAEAAESNSLLAEQAFDEAERLRAEWNEHALRLAIEKYKTASARWLAIGDKRRAARSVENVGEICGLLGQTREALENVREALKLSRTINDPPLRVQALNNACSLYAFEGDSVKAVGLCNEALRLSRDAGDRRGEAQALNNLGEASAFSDFERALSLFEQALALWRASGDRRGEAQALNNLGYASADRSDLGAALTYFNQALDGWRAEGDLFGEAQTVNALGVLHSKLGEKQQALASHARAQELFRTIGSPSGELTALTGIGYVYDSLGEKEKALSCYTEALRIARAIGRREGELVLLIHVGNINDALGNKDEALNNYEAALALSRTMADTRMQAYSLNFIGGIYDSRQQTKLALTYFRRALALSRAAVDRRGEAGVLNNIGHVYDHEGRKERALGYYKSALALHLATSDHGGEAATRYNMARAQRDRGDLDDARAQIEAALDIVESLRTNVSGDELRVPYFASVQQYYGLYIDILMQGHKLHPADGLAALAFQASERARARGLLDLLVEARADIPQSIDPALREKEHTLQQTLNAKVERQIRLLGTRHTEEEAAAAAEEVRKLTLEDEELRAQIREKSPRYAALTQPRPLSSEDVQRMLDENTLLLEYSLGDERSYLWAVTKTGFSSYELPARARIEELTREAYDSLTARQSGDAELPAQAEARGRELDTRYWQQARELGGMILEPVSPQLGAKRLLVVGDGALLHIPFGALPVPLSAGAREQTLAAYDGEPAPLLVEHEIINLPSVSALALIRDEAAERRPGRKAVAVLADPVFERDDPRIESSPDAQAAVGSASADEAHRAMRDAGVGAVGGGIPRLLGSGTEAEEIMRLVPRGAGFEAVGFRANLETVRSPDLGQYRIVHFATHGILDDEHPELSGIVLSLFDERGRPRDGFLSLREVYNLHLPADLVVLSACGTGLGREVRGEGLVGLTRGFIYAGAARVVASLWKVDDDATAELMKYFYAGMLRKGLAPSAALREAQLSMWRSKRWHAPYYWAAFVLHGEYRASVGGDRRDPERDLIITAGGVILLLSLLGLFVWRRRKFAARKR